MSSPAGAGNLAPHRRGDSADGLTFDLGGRATTAEVTQRVIELLEGSNR